MSKLVALFVVSKFCMWDVQSQFADTEDNTCWYVMAACVPALQ